MSENEVWRHGDEHAQRPDGALPLGRADFQAAGVLRTSVPGYALYLQIAEPPPRHANILGWPDVSLPEVRNQLAMELRDKANPIVKDRSASAA